MESPSTQETSAKDFQSIKSCAENSASENSRPQLGICSSPDESKDASKILEAGCFVGDGLSDSLSGLGSHRVPSLASFRQIASQNQSIRWRKASRRGLFDGVTCNGAQSRLVSLSSRTPPTGIGQQKRQFAKGQAVLRPPELHQVGGGFVCDDSSL